MNTPIPFNRPYIVGKELYYIAQAVLSNNQISGDGGFTKKCQSWLESTLGTPKALLTHSGTGALDMSAILCNIGPGDEIIMPSFTFVSTANAFVLRGGTPIFIDIRKDTLNIDETRLEDAISKHTKAIVPVHYAGTACDMNSIITLSRNKQIKIIEDAAQALLSIYNGKYLGTIGDLGCLSFHETKNIISGEGGALLINDPDLVERAEIIWEKGTDRKRFFRGQVDKYTWIDIGSSFLPSDIIAAFLYAQLEMAETIIKTRQMLMQAYMLGLSELERKGRIRLPSFDPESVANGHIMYIITNSLDERSRLINFLKQHGIMSVFHFVPLHSSPMGIKYCRVSGSMEITNNISDRLLRLPMYYEMQKSDVDRVVNAVLSFYYKN